MSDLRKTILASIFISLLVGTVAGATGGIAVGQLINGKWSQTLLSKLPFVVQLQQSVVSSQQSEVEDIPPTINSPPSSETSGDGTLSTVEVVRRVSPAVVSILITKEVSARSTGPIFPEDLFREFGFEIKAPEQLAQSQKRQVGGGTGFIIGAEGLIITNKHVIFDDKAEYTVITADGQRFPAKITARDPFIDIGFLKIEAKGLPIVKLGDSDKLEIGESVIAIGNALSEFSNTITSGVVSGIKRRVTAGGPGIGSEVIEEAIQTDAAINPGNSGGPLVNLRGEVVGVNTATSKAGQLIGFATPINQVKPLVESVKKSGRIIRPWLGVRYVILNPELKAKNNLPVDYGALLVRGDQPMDLAVIPGSPADKTGLKENDIILEMDKVKITEETPLARQIQKHQPGQTVKLKILSSGKEKEVKVALEELKQ